MRKRCGFLEIRVNKWLILFESYCMSHTVWLIRFDEAILNRFSEMQSFWHWETLHLMAGSAFGFRQRMKKFLMHLPLSLAKDPRLVFILIGWVETNSDSSRIRIKLNPILAWYQKNLVRRERKRFQRRINWISESTQGSFSNSSLSSASYSARFSLAHFCQLLIGWIWKR